MAIDSNECYKCKSNFALFVFVYSTNFLKIPTYIGVVRSTGKNIGLLMRTKPRAERYKYLTNYMIFSIEYVQCTTHSQKIYITLYMILKYSHDFK